MVDDTQAATPARQKLTALPPIEGLEWLLRKRQQQLSADYSRFMHQGGEEALHDFRVSLRRLRSLLRSYRAYIGGDKALRQLLREIQHSTNYARDIEVFIYQLKQYHPEQFQLISTLESEQQQAYRSLRERLPAAWDRLPAEISAALQFRQTQNHPTLGSLVTRAGRQQFKNLNSGFKALRQDWDEKLVHRLRIEGKRLRYLLEPYLESSQLHSAIDNMKLFQDELGEYRDRQLLLHYLQTEQAANTPLIASVQTELQRQRHRLKRFQKRSEQKRFMQPLQSALKQIEQC